MTTELQKVLREQASSKLFDSTGDRTNKDLCYYTGGLESLLAGIAEAAVADGVNPRTVIKMLVRNAFQMPDERLHSMFDPSPAEIDALKRDVAA